MKFITISAIFLAFAVTAPAQSPAKILKQAENALGGAKALQALTSTSKRGRITRVSDGAAGSYLYQTSSPNLFNERFDLNGFETETGTNGRSGWTRNSRDGLQTLTGEASVDLQAKAMFRNHLWLNAKAEKSKITAAGSATVGSKTANVLIYTTPKGVAIKLYFDTASGLLIRDEIPNGGLTETTDYRDYRDVNGVKQSFETRITVGDQTYEIKFGSVKTGQQIAKSQFDFPDLSGAALPDIPNLLKDLQSNEDKVEAVLDNYSYTQKIIQREQGKDGVLREKSSETYQMSFYKGNHMKRLIEKNGKPLNEKEQANEDKDATKRVDDIEKKIARQDANQGDQSENDRRISVAEMLRASKLENPRRERFRGRDVIVFDFQPDPAFDMKNAKSMIKFFGKTAGVMWVDEQDKQVARIEAVLADNFNIGGGVVAKLKKGASFTIDKERVNDEIWLPSQADINLSLRVLLVKGVDLNQVIKSYDYRKFSTEVKDAQVNETKKP